MASYEYNRSFAVSIAKTHIQFKYTIDAACIYVRDIAITGVYLIGFDGFYSKAKVTYRCTEYAMVSDVMQHAM